MAFDNDTLLRKYFSNAISPEELEELRSILGVTSDGQLEPLLRNLFEQSEGKGVSRSKRRRLYQTIARRAGLKEQRPRLTLHRFFAPIAAVVIALIIGGAWLYFHRTNRDAVTDRPVISQKNILKDTDIATISNVSQRDLQQLKKIYPTMTGKTRRVASTKAYKRAESLGYYGSWITLPDNTRVKLGPDATLYYDASTFRANRSVLASGTLFFYVTKDPDRPFVVHTPSGDLRVYGTQFYVSASQNKDENGSCQGQLRRNAS